MKKFVDILLKSLMFILFASSIIIALCYSGKSYAANNSTTVFVYPKGNVSANIINILKVNGYIIVTSPQNANYVINYGQINKPGKETTLLVVPNGNISSNILSVLQSNGYNVVVIPSQNAAEYPAATSPQPVVVPEPYPYPVPYPYYAYPYPDYLVPGILGGVIIGGFLYRGWGGFRGRGGFAFHGRR